MSEKQPLYILANQEEKELTELLFWYEFQMTQMLLAVLANAPISNLPMVLIYPDNGQVFRFLNMPHTIEARLAKDWEVSNSIKEKVDILRESI